MSININQIIEQVATPENVQKYHETTDKFVFCLDLMGLSLVLNSEKFCERAVNALEDRLENITIH